MDKEEVYEKLLELSKAQGQLNALAFFNEKDLLKKDNTKRLIKEIFDKVEDVRNYIQSNYQKLRTH